MRAVMRLQSVRSDIREVFYMGYVKQELRELQITSLLLNCVVAPLRIRLVFA